MLQLPNDCYVNTFGVFPNNWKRIGASSLKKPWYIFYRFHDPAYKHLPKYKHGLLRVLKGMNEIKDLSERREMVQYLIDAEKEILACGFNPIRGITPTQAPKQDHELSPDTQFIEALWKAYEKIKGVSGTRIDMKSVLKGTEKAARQLQIHDYAIKIVTRKYFKRIFEQCAINNPRFSAKRQNRYRAYLSRIYKELIELEVVEVNPLRDLAVLPTVKKQRILLTREERRAIDIHLKKNHYTYWRCLNIFFHSGARETEIMKVQVKDVDIINQRCKYTILKSRGGAREVYRPIKDIALDLWKELIQRAAPDDFIFSVGLIPGNKPIRPDQLGRRWTVHVKKKMGIKANMYCLKHLNMTEIVDNLNEEDAARLAAHTTTAMVRSIYDTNRENRQNERIKKVGNTFV